MFYLFFSLFLFNYNKIVSLHTHKTASASAWRLALLRFSSQTIRPLPAKSGTSTGHKYWYTLVLNMCPTSTLKNVASNSPRGLLQAQRIPRFPDNQHMKVKRLSAIRTGCFTPQEIFLVLVSVTDNDTIGNRTRHLPVCSAVPQPTAPPPALFKT